jgi:hypothetical protein
MQNSEVYIITTSVFLIHNENAFKKMDYTYNTVKFSDPSSMHLEKG